MLYVYRNFRVTLCSLLWGVLYVPWIIHTVEHQLLGKAICVLFHMVHTQSIRFIVDYLERVKRSLSVVGTCIQLYLCQMQNKYTVYTNGKTEMMFCCV